MNFHKKTRILLISANKLTNPYPVFPLGVAFLEAALQKAGYEVGIWDQLLHDADSLESGLAWADAVGVSLRNVDNVSSTNPVAYVDDYKALIREIRRKTSVPIVVGGSAFSIFPAELLEELDLDWGIQGEAEVAIVNWMEVINGNRPPERVPGLVYRLTNGEVRIVPPVAISAEKIPSPRPGLNWIRQYIQRGGMLNVQTQRGCALHCTYCTYPWIEGRCYRHREAGQLVKELAHLKAAGCNYVFLTDSVFNTSNRHVEAFCKAILMEGLKLNWGCFARPRNLRGEILDLMVEAGLKHLEFGSDSFSDTTLETYGKGFRFRDILEASEEASKRNIHLCHYLIFGGPGETESTIRETVANSRQLPDAPIFAYSGMRMYPHTPLYKTSGDGKSARELLRPSHYEPAGLPLERVEEIVREATQGLPNWFLSDHADDNEALLTKFRRKGKQGPLWEYLALARRLNEESNFPHQRA